MKKLVLSCDLSLTCPAFAILEVDTNTSTITVIEVSHVKTVSKQPLGQRLFAIVIHLRNILDRFAITDVVMEKGFNKFAVATAQLQRVVGVVVLTLYRKDLAVFAEISPTSVKKEITGNGKASKEELADALVMYVGPIDYKTNDESDAVGVGIAYAKQKGWL